MVEVRDHGSAECQRLKQTRLFLRRTLQVGKDASRKRASNPTRPKGALCQRKYLCCGKKIWSGLILFGCICATSPSPYRSKFCQISIKSIITHEVYSLSGRLCLCWLKLTVVKGAGVQLCALGRGLCCAVVVVAQL